MGGCSEGLDAVRIFFKTYQVFFTDDMYVDNNTVRTVCMYGHTYGKSMD